MKPEESKCFFGGMTMKLWGEDYGQKDALHVSRAKILRIAKVPSTNPTQEKHSPSKRWYGPHHWSYHPTMTRLHSHK